MAKKRKRKTSATKPRPVTKPGVARARASKAKASRRSAQKKPPTLTVKQGGRKPEAVRSKRRAAATAKVQPFAAAVKVRSGGIHATPPAKRPRKLSKHPDAVRARKYRRERKALAEALEAARLEALERRRAKDRERRKRKKGGGGVIKRDERELAGERLERIREISAGYTPTSLEIVPPEANVSNAWMAVGRFDLLDPVSYAELGEIFQAIADDVLLEASVHPQRLCQVRVIYHDPNARRGESDSIVSRIAGWQYMWSDLLGEVLGGRAGDETALAVRYEETEIGLFYVYFSSEITKYETVPFGKVSGGGSSQARTQTIRLR